MKNNKSFVTREFLLVKGSFKDLLSRKFFVSIIDLLSFLLVFIVVAHSISSFYSSVNSLSYLEALGMKAQKLISESEDIPPLDEKSLEETRQGISAVKKLLLKTALNVVIALLLVCLITGLSNALVWSLMLEKALSLVFVKRIFLINLSFLLPLFATLFYTFLAVSPLLAGLMVIPLIVVYSYLTSSTCSIADLSQPFTSSLSSGLSVAVRFYKFLFSLAFSLLVFFLISLISRLFSFFGTTTALTLFLIMMLAYASWCKLYFMKTAQHIYKSITRSRK